MFDDADTVCRSDAIQRWDHSRRRQNDEIALLAHEPLCSQYSRSHAHINTLIQTQRVSMARSASEVAFFKALRSELQKSSRFFRTAEQILEIRRERIAEALHQLRNAGLRAPGTKSALLDDSDDRALSACVTYYRDLLLLENYAIINYCGFSKILKKHDKRTGYDTRARFMRVCVAPQPFTHYPRLLEMIKEAEELYLELSKAATRSRNLDSASRPVRLNRHGQWSDKDAKPPDVEREEGINNDGCTGAIEIASKHAPRAPGEQGHQQPPVVESPNGCARTRQPSTELMSELNQDSWARSDMRPWQQHPKRSLSAIRREESDFIDAILNLRSEAARLRAVEDSTSGILHTVSKRQSCASDFPNEDEANGKRFRQK
mmetsp:Transcript_20977/g.65878  ORF Transcript_20977/g.65878 Transcript_20977/m.65878 type:complete len:375 (-) Transcript_20977:181-1305(-)